MDSIDEFTDVEKLGIEFIKSYEREHNEDNQNQFLDYSPLEGTDKMYPVVEFRRKDPIGYMKIKDQDLFLQTNGKFTEIKENPVNRPPNCNQYKVQPLVLWFEYLYERVFVIYRFSDFGLNGIRKRRNVRKQDQNYYYLQYSEGGGKIQLKWTEQLKDATKFRYGEIIWNQMHWKYIRRECLSQAWGSPGKSVYW